MRNKVQLLQNKFTIELIVLKVFPVFTARAEPATKVTARYQIRGWQDDPGCLVASFTVPVISEDTHVGVICMVIW